jgi:hypothetical protein
MYNQDYPITVVGSLDAAEDSCLCAMEGFSRLAHFFQAMERFADLAGFHELTTLAKEGQEIAWEYHNVADVDREQYKSDKGETSRHG